MENRFAAALKRISHITYTENGATALKTTSSALVDLFAVIGALRTRSEESITRLFASAYDEDPLLAVKMAFYARNIRGGLGERRTFRIILKYLAAFHPETVIHNLDAIALFGRYDDFYVLVDTPAEAEMWQYLKNQFELDLLHMQRSQPVSLLGKWLKSVNASSKKTCHLGRLTSRNFGLTNMSYRKALSALRQFLDVTETKMSAGNWTDIIYSNVPSCAMSIYRHAFMAHDPEGFNTYMNSLEKGETTINASTLFPYDIIERLKPDWCYDNCENPFAFQHYDPVLEMQWKALPDYTCSSNDVLIMADTSGSMTYPDDRPLCTSIGLALYFAERNQGAFKNMFMTFSSSPSLVTVKGKTLYDKIRCVPSDYTNTNLEAAFDLILETAVSGQLKPDELPKALVIISDMEFDIATSSKQVPYDTLYDTLSKKFMRHGYRLPNIIFWNVNARHTAFQVSSGHKGVQLASGYSPSVFKSIMTTINKTPYEAMLSTLNDPLYDCISL